MAQDHRVDGLEVLPTMKKELAPGRREAKIFWQRQR
jgi:hypothetical protein